MDSSRRMRSVSKVRLVETVDHSTGEVTREESEQHFKVKYELYARLFKDSMWSLCDDMSGNDFRVFIYLIGEVRDGSNVVNLGYSNYKDLEGGLFRGSNVSSFRRSIKRLIDCGLIKRIMQNVYIVNPEVSHSGNSGDKKNVVLEWHSVGAVSPLFNEERGEYSKLINSSDNE
jgi:hypothetical protein